MAQQQSIQSGGGVIAVGNDGDILMLVGTGTPPADNSSGYGHGCIYIRLDGTGTGDAMYVNRGTSALANFDSKTID